MAGSDEEILRAFEVLVRGADSHIMRQANEVPHLLIGISHLVLSSILNIISFRRSIDTCKTRRYRR